MNKLRWKIFDYFVNLFNQSDWGEWEFLTVTHSYKQTFAIYISRHKINKTYRIKSEIIHKGDSSDWFDRMIIDKIKKDLS